MNFVLTDHAAARCRRRKIETRWIHDVLSDPEALIEDPDDTSLEHRMAMIPEAGFRVLRVVCEATGEPLRVITAYFDDGASGQP